MAWLAPSRKEGAARPPDKPQTRAIMTTQTGILAEVPTQARYLTFKLAQPELAAAALGRLRDFVNPSQTVTGIGRALADALGHDIPGLKVFPAWSGRGLDIPSTPASLWLWLRGDDRGELLHRGRHIERLLAPAFTLDSAIDAFRYDIGRDLSGYEDGTENPTGDDAIAAAIASDQGAGLDGGSFVAVQQWRHDLDRLEAMSSEQRDHTIGRRISDNEEIDDAPESAHVRRTAQEDFEPEAFVLRRSMPWSENTQCGLVFVAFGKSFDAFEALLQRMLGEDDGVTDALFSFTTPVTGSYFWCPPTANGKLDLSALGIAAKT